MVATHPLPGDSCWYGMCATSLSLSLHLLYLYAHIYTLHVEFRLLASLCCFAACICSHLCISVAYISCHSSHCVSSIACHVLTPPYTVCHVDDYLDSSTVDQLGVQLFLLFYWLRIRCHVPTLLSCLSSSVSVLSRSCKRWQG